MISNPKQDILFILSIDTEEEWDWTGPFPQNNFSVKNTKYLPDFHQFCCELNIRPTYFVDYAVANDHFSVNILKKILSTNTTEIGAHLHPWCNPPLYGKTTEKKSHVVNLPITQVEEKLDSLIKLLVKNFNIYPNSFRTGRWGINADILKMLAEKGVQIDSSMYPLYKNEYFNCEDTPLTPFWPDYNKQTIQGAQRSIIEIPVTAGFNRINYKLWNKVHNFFSSPVLKPFHPIGILWKTGLLKKIYLSPELHTAEDMCKLIDSSLKLKHPVIHMYLHSSSFVDNSTGLMMMQAENSLEFILDNIKKVVSHISKHTNITFCTMSEAAHLIQNRTY